MYLFEKTNAMILSTQPKQLELHANMYSVTESLESTARLKVLEKSKSPSMWKIYLGAFSAYIFTILFGMVETYSAPATVDMKEKGSRFINITEDQITWIASVPILTSGIGSFVSGYMTHYLGRKATLITISPLYVLSWLMVAYAPTVNWIYAGRVISGMCFGIALVATPAYVIEIAPVKIRGFLGTGNHFFIAVGNFIMITLGYGLRWSWLAISGATVTALGACLMFTMPESPEWLYQNSMRAEALKSLRFFKGKHLNVDEELKTMTENMVQPPTKTKNTWRQFLDPAFYKPALLAMGLIFFQKFSGINAVNAYTVEIFKNTGSTLDAQSSSVLFAAVNIVTTTLGSILMDRSGRRILYIISGSVLTVSLTLIGVYLLLLERKSNLSNLNWIPLLCLIAYIAAYSLGLGSIPLVMIPELVPIASRSTVLALALTFGSLLGFAITKSFSFVVHHFQYYGLFWMFGMSTFASVLFGVFCLPETKGRTINEINSSFSHKTQLSED